MTADAATKRARETPIANVSDTAFWIAHYRAMETQRPDALFRDPLAAVLAGERGAQIARQMPRGFMTEWAVVMRTCIIDEYIRETLAEGVDTVLNLGAGLDTRPYRMDLPPSLLWIEADYPAMIEYKGERLATDKPRCKLEREKIDLSDVPARRDFLAQANARAKKLLVLSEGVVPYLDNDSVASLAEDLRALDRAQYWVVDYFSPALLKYRERMLGGKMQNAPFKFYPPDWFAFFEQHGWRRRAIRYLAEEAERRGRRLQMPLLVQVVTVVRLLFASKERQAAFRKLAGYALLERIT